MGTTENKKFPPLCGGVFFTILKPYRSDRISPQLYYNEIKDPKSDIPTIIELIGVVKPDFLEKKNLPTFGAIKTYTSKFLNCRENVPNGLEIGKPGYIASFNAQMDDHYHSLLLRMHSFLDQSIGLHNKDGSPKTAELAQLVREIIEIMENDPACINAEFRIGKNGEWMRLSAAKTVYFQSFILGVWHYIVASKISNELKGNQYDDWNSSKNKGASAKHRFKLAIQDLTSSKGADTAANEETADDIKVITDAEQTSESEEESDKRTAAGTNNSDASQGSSQQFEYEEDQDEKGKTVNQTLFYNAGNGVQIKTLNGGLTLHIGN